VTPGNYTIKLSCLASSWGLISLSINLQGGDGFLVQGILESFDRFLSHGVVDVESAVWFWERDETEKRLHPLFIIRHIAI